MRTDEQATPMPLKEQDSRNLPRGRVPAANMLPQQCRRCRERSRESRRRMRCRPPRFGVHVRGATGSIALARRRSASAPAADLSVRRARSSRSVPFTDNRAAPPFSRRRCGAERSGTPPSRVAKCPTKCLSTRPIRRRPGWSCCAAIASKNLISRPRNANNCAAISIWQR